jgi:hypothetical protein
MDDLLPDANVYRTASGAPGTDYWQQEVDYAIDVHLDDQEQTITGCAEISYTNHSPDRLNYLWLQLDANYYRPDADAVVTSTASWGDRVSFPQMQQLLARQSFNGGVNIRAVTDADGQALPHTIVKTMMRVDLSQPLDPDQQFVFKVEWDYQINNAKLVSGRTGYEHFSKDDNYIYEIAQWFPRLAAYTDVTGWQHKQFLGRGEFTLEFGDYLVRITVPDDHIVGATGVLMNPEVVLSQEQRQRLEQAKSAEQPLFIVTPEEARANEQEKSEGEKTWIFKADRVRDFAFASSRKFIWDAKLHRLNGKPVMAMSLYPNEAEPLWSKYSTRAIIHTLNVYSRYTFDFPYPVAYSVNGPVGGMEYPMICFNGPRPESDGTYSERTKRGLISVVIHEVGHNYFPMVVNSDERQWSWMDEGMNTFLQFLAEQEWEKDYPSRRGEPEAVVGYMRSNAQVPIMTNSESVLQFHYNAYAKPAVALNVLRETVLGRELFDFAFQEYANRWKFKRPTPADFFRTMEDASGVDLDWFFRGWFFTTNHNDIAIQRVRRLELDTRDPDVEKPKRKAREDGRPTTLSQQRNEKLPKLVDSSPELRDFYDSLDPWAVTEEEREAYKRYWKQLNDEERQLLKEERYIYQIDFENLGGLVMPIILQIESEDGTTEIVRIPAEIWRRNAVNASKLLVLDRPIRRVLVDPFRETADTDTENNAFPRTIDEVRYRLDKPRTSSSNQMQRHRAAEKKAGQAE